MSRYILSPLASADLREIHDYIAEQDLDAALDAVTRLELACEKLAKMPEMGRKRRELGSTLRSLAVGHYVIFYRIIKGGVEIIRVLHGARDIRTILADDEA